jgi:acyl-CoA oxidase
VPCLLHDSMFMFCLKHFADDEQQKKWLDKAERKELLGTYAQTEVDMAILFTILVGTWF